MNSLFKYKYLNYSSFLRLIYECKCKCKLIYNNLIQNIRNKTR